VAAVPLSGLGTSSLARTRHGRHKRAGAFDAAWASSLRWLRHAIRHGGNAAFLHCITRLPLGRGPCAAAKRGVVAHCWRQDAHPPFGSLFLPLSFVLAALPAFAHAAPSLRCAGGILLAVRGDARTLPWRTAVRGALPLFSPAAARGCITACLLPFSSGRDDLLVRISSAEITYGFYLCCLRRVFTMRAFCSWRAVCVRRSTSGSCASRVRQHQRHAAARWRRCAQAAALQTAAGLAGWREEAHALRS